MKIYEEGILNMDNFLISTKNIKKRIFILIIGTLISAFGMALLVKSNLGQSTVGGFSYNISMILNLKVGTVVALVNYICFVGQIIILKGNFRFIRILQLLITYIFASTMNLFLYTIPIISNLSLNSYLFKVIVLLLGITCMSYGVSLSLKADIVILPFEAFFYEISIKSNIKFGSLRRLVDIILVIISLTIIYIFKIPNNSVREGTIIYTFLFGTLLNVFMELTKE
ncbi:MAG: hypothetical protein JXM74_05565 [Fusobacteriaceae bacterium]|nr:hypothetical protein [Fusobacteriaceae bacterium]